MKYYAVTVDPLTYAPENLRAKYRNSIDSLKRSNDFDYNLAFDKALDAGRITERQNAALKGYVADLIAFKSSNPEKQAVQQWCLQKEQEIKDRTDLSFAEKNFVLTIQSFFRYYLKAMSEDLADEGNSFDPKRGRVLAINDDCDVLCPLGFIATFVGIGSAIGGVSGGAIFFGAAVLALLVQPDICACPTNVCTYVRGISVEDVCYNPSVGLKFKAFGYGSNPQPVDLTWYFYRDALKSTPDVVKSSGTSGVGFDQMILTDAEIAGASQIAVKVLSNCGGNYLNSAHFGWYVKANLGKPRFVIYNLDSSNPNTGHIGQNSHFGITGANYIPVNWFVSPTYATVLQNNQYGANFIVQWHYPTGTATVSATANSACGSSVQSLSIQTLP